MTTVRRLRVLVFEESPSTWVAQAVEYDIAAQGHTPENAVEQVLKVLQAHINFDRRHNREPLSCFQPAPGAYWKALAHSIPLEVFWKRNHPEPDVPTEIIASVAHQRPAPPLAIFRSAGGRAPQQRFKDASRYARTHAR